MIESKRERGTLLLPSGPHPTKAFLRRPVSESSRLCRPPDAHGESGPSRRLELSAERIHPQPVAKVPRGVAPRIWLGIEAEKRRVLKEIRGVSTTKSPSQSRKRRPRDFCNGLLTAAPSRRGYAGRAS